MTAGLELYCVHAPMHNRSCADYRFVCVNNITALAVVVNSSQNVREREGATAPESDRERERGRERARGGGHDRRP